jgi:hypothetical protein
MADEKSKLNLEFNNKFLPATDTFLIGKTGISVTPPLDEDYWVFRIKLHREQSLVAFPKFGTIGIGFAVEKDWNTNLPYSCDTDVIYNHIKHNKKYKAITEETCIEAIEILKKAAEYYDNNEMPDIKVKVGDKNDMVEYFMKMKKFVYEQ